MVMNGKRTIKRAGFCILLAVLCCSLCACSLSVESLLKRMKAYINGDELPTPPEDFVEARESRLYQYDVYRDYVVITGYLGKEVQVEIPAQLDGLPVRKIASLAFYEGVKVESVVVPEGVTELEENAFYYCSAMTSITLPDSLTTIGDKCFSWCSALETVKLPSGLRALSGYCFNQCTSLQSVSLPKGLAAVGVRAFSGCENLKVLLLGESVTSVGSYAFRDCKALEVVSLSGVCTLGEEVFAGCPESLLVVTKEDSPCWDACKELGVQLGRDVPASALPSVDLPDDGSDTGSNG